MHNRRKSLKGDTAAIGGELSILHIAYEGFDQFQLALKVHIYAQRRGVSSLLPDGIPQVIVENENDFCWDGFIASEIPFLMRRKSLVLSFGPGVAAEMIAKKHAELKERKTAPSMTAVPDKTKASTASPCATPAAAPSLKHESITPPASPVSPHKGSGGNGARQALKDGGNASVNFSTVSYASLDGSAYNNNNNKPGTSRATFSNFKSPFSTDEGVFGSGDGGSFDFTATAANNNENKALLSFSLADIDYDDEDPNDDVFFLCSDSVVAAACEAIPQLDMIEKDVFVWVASRALYRARKQLPEGSISLDGCRDIASEAFRAMDHHGMKEGTCRWEDISDLLLEETTLRYAAVSFRQSSAESYDRFMIKDWPSVPPTAIKALPIAESPQLLLMDHVPRAGTTAGRATHLLHGKEAYSASVAINELMGSYITVHNEVDLSVKKYIQRSGPDDIKSIEAAVWVGGMGHGFTPVLLVLGGDMCIHVFDYGPNAVRPRLSRTHIIRSETTQTALFLMESDQLVCGNREGVLGCYNLRTLLRSGKGDAIGKVIVHDDANIAPIQADQNKVRSRGGDSDSDSSDNGSPHTGNLHRMKGKKSARGSVSHPRVRYVDLDDGVMGQVAAHPQHPITAIARTSPITLVTSGLDGFISLLHIPDWSITKRFLAEPTGVTGMVYSSLHQCFVTMTYDTTFKLWAGFSGANPLTFRDSSNPHTRNIINVAILREAPHVVSMDGDGMVKTWDIRSTACLHSKKVISEHEFTAHTNSCHSVVYQPKYRRILAIAKNYNHAVAQFVSGASFLTAHGSDRVQFMALAKSSGMIISATVTETKIWDGGRGGLRWGSSSNESKHTVSKESKITKSSNSPNSSRTNSPTRRRDPTSPNTTSSPDFSSHTHSSTSLASFADSDKTAMCVDDDGNKIAFATVNGTIHEQRISTGRIVSNHTTFSPQYDKTKPDPDAISVVSIAYSSATKELVAVCANGTMRYFADGALSSFPTRVTCIWSEHEIKQARKEAERLAQLATKVAKAQELLDLETGIAGSPSHKEQTIRARRNSMLAKGGVQLDKSSAARGGASSNNDTGGGKPANLAAGSDPVVMCTVSTATQFMAIATLSGRIKLVRMASPTGVSTHEFAVPAEITAMVFLDPYPCLAVGDSAGGISLFLVRPAVLLTVVECFGSTSGNGNVGNGAIPSANAANPSSSPSAEGTFDNLYQWATRLQYDYGYPVAMSLDPQTATFYVADHNGFMCVYDLTPFIFAMHLQPLWGAESLENARELCRQLKEVTEARWANQTGGLSLEAQSMFRRIGSAVFGSTSTVGAGDGASGQAPGNRLSTSSYQSSASDGSGEVQRQPPGTASSVMQSHGIDSGPFPLTLTQQLFLASAITMRSHFKGIIDGSDPQFIEASKVTTARERKRSMAVSQQNGLLLSPLMTPMLADSSGVNFLSPFAGGGLGSPAIAPLPPTTSKPTGANTKRGKGQITFALGNSGNKASTSVANIDKVSKSAPQSVISYHSPSSIPLITTSNPDGAPLLLATPRINTSFSTSFDYEGAPFLNLSANQAAIEGLARTSITSLGFSANGVNYLGSNVALVTVSEECFDFVYQMQNEIANVGAEIRRKMQSSPAFYTRMTRSSSTGSADSNATNAKTSSTSESSEDDESDPESESAQAGSPTDEPLARTRKYPVSIAKGSENDLIQLAKKKSKKALKAEFKNEYHHLVSKHSLRTVLKRHCKSSPYFFLPAPTVDQTRKSISNLLPQRRGTNNNGPSTGALDNKPKNKPSMGPSSVNLRRRRQSSTNAVKRSLFALTAVSGQSMDVASPGALVEAVEGEGAPMNLNVSTAKKHKKKAAQTANWEPNTVNPRSIVDDHKYAHACWAPFQRRVKPIDHLPHPEELFKAAIPSELMPFVTAGFDTLGGLGGVTPVNGNLSPAGASSVIEKADGMGSDYLTTGTNSKARIGGVGIFSGGATNAKSRTRPGSSAPSTAAGRMFQNAANTALLNSSTATHLGTLANGCVVVSNNDGGISLWARGLKTKITDINCGAIYTSVITELARQIGANYKSSRGLDLGKQQMADIRTEIKSILRQLGAAGSYFDFKVATSAHRALLENYKEWLWTNDMARVKAEKVMANWNQKKSEVRQYSSGFVFGESKPPASLSVVALANPSVAVPSTAKQLPSPKGRASLPMFPNRPTIDLLQQRDAGRTRSAVALFQQQINNSAATVAASPKKAKFAFISDEESLPREESATTTTPLRKANTTAVFGGSVSPTVAVTPPMGFSPMISASPTASPVASSFQINDKDGRLAADQADLALASQTMPFMALPSLDGTPIGRGKQSEARGSPKPQIKINSPRNFMDKKPGITTMEQVNESSEEEEEIDFKTVAVGTARHLNKPRGTPLLADTAKATPTSSPRLAHVHNLHSYDTSPHSSTAPKRLDNPLLKTNGSFNGSFSNNIASNVLPSKLKGRVPTPPSNFAKPNSSVASLGRPRPQRQQQLKSKEDIDWASGQVARGQPPITKVSASATAFLNSSALALDDANGLFGGAGCDLGVLVVDHSPRRPGAVNAVKRLLPTNSSAPPLSLSTSQPPVSQTSDFEFLLSRIPKGESEEEVQVSTAPSNGNTSPRRRNRQRKDSHPIVAVDPRFRAITGAANNFGFDIPKPLGSIVNRK